MSNDALPPFRSDLVYGLQNEDSRTEAAVLARIGRPGARVLMIASSGENALSLLTIETVGTVVACDMNPAQIHLGELRRAAVRVLGRDDHLRLMGDARATNADRLALYDVVAAQLPDATRVYWDSRREAEIAYGVQRAGRNEVLSAHLRMKLAMAGFAPLTAPLAVSDLPRWQAVYRDVMSVDKLLATLGLPARALAEQIAGIADALGKTHFDALRQAHAQRNPFVTTVFRGGYSGAAVDEDGLPPYLQRANYETLRAAGRPMIQEVVRECMSVDDALLASLPDIERGPWFRTIACGFRSAAGG